MCPGLVIHHDARRATSDDAYMPMIMTVMITARRTDHEDERLRCSVVADRSIPFHSCKGHGSSCIH